MPRTVLLTARDAIKYGPPGANTPEGVLEQHIAVREWSLARNCFGSTFYDELLEDAIAYDCPKNWQPGTWALDAVVIYGGELYKNTVANNTKNPCEASSGYTKARTFTTQCFEDLWTSNLRRYLAYMVTAESLDYLTYPISAKGVMEFAEDASGMRTARESSVKYMKSKIIGDAQDMLLMMKEYMVAKKDTCGFSSAKFLVDSCVSGSCAQVPKRTKRFHFRTDEPSEKTITPTAISASTLKKDSRLYTNQTGNTVTTDIQLPDPAAYSAAQIRAIVTVVVDAILPVYGTDYTYAASGANWVLTFASPLVSSTVTIIVTP